MNEDERRRAALLNYAKALLQYAKDKGDKRGVKHWKKEIKMLEDKVTKPCHDCTNYEQGKCKKKNGAITSIARITNDGQTLPNGQADECFEEELEK